MKRCPKCGAPSTRAGEKFCVRCGAPLSETPPQATTWPPQAAVRRRRRLWIVTILALVVVLAAAIAVGVLFFRSSRPVSAPAEPIADSQATPAAAAPEESDRLYLENLTAVEQMKVTANGTEVPYYVAEDGRVYLDRADVTRTDTLLRAILPSGNGYQTTLALVSKPSNPTAAFGTLTVCDEEGYNDPDGDYLDAMLSVYYRSLLQAYNSRKVEDLRFSTDLNDQSWTEAITTGAYDAVQYDLEKSDMGFTTTGLAYGDHKVTLNVYGAWVGTNRETGQTETGTDYMTIQAIWRDGMWQIDRCLPCTETDFESGTLMLSTH